MKDYDFIFTSVEAMLSEKRFNHCLRVQKEAVKLGKIYGVDINKCSIAAIVHDCNKNLSDHELLEKANEYGIFVDDIQMKSPQLLHGPVGAEYCRIKFEIEDIDVLNSVKYHTTGRKDMSILEKIIYLADLTEDGRDFQNVERIRELSYTDINSAIILSCDNTLHYVIERGFLIHPLTIELRNSLLMKGGK